ncbi:hypothetical protein BJF84_24030 [Rhodococcus sp. CUA-806]|nr:hypothetical protein BJF84_24030 [Rhodococcus sp. CUA-806]
MLRYERARVHGDRRVYPIFDQEKFDLRVLPVQIRHNLRGAGTPCDPLHYTGVQPNLLDARDVHVDGGRIDSQTEAIARMRLLDNPEGVLQETIDCCHELRAICGNARRHEITCRHTRFDSG